MAIKISLNKLKLKKDLRTIIKSTVENGIEILPIITEHILKVMELKYFHRDPFDRLIISQAIVEDLSVITADSEFKKYGIKHIW